MRALECYVYFSKVCFKNFYSRLTSDHGVSFVAVGLFCLNRLTWIYSLGAEVFALNNLMVAVIMYLTVQFEAAVRAHQLKQCDRATVLKVSSNQR